MLSNFDIENICYDLKLSCIGVFSKDRLPHMPYKGAYFINLQNINDGGGTHFTFMFLDNTSGLYFDSFGMPPPTNINHLIKNKKMMYNNRQIQDLHSEKCGWFCIALDYYLKYDANMARTLEEKYEDFLNIWGSPERNDDILKEYLEGKISDKGEYI